ncbi:hypothetical protein LEN26_012258 [Aphanomyces euteiches]|nr:hypothetical protein LEN26_012258 [Aphanomyces euteiches]KAH9164882.1 hypothetical protein AeNC1_018613 [Aphanomyces euteiches]
MMDRLGVAETIPLEEALAAEIDLDAMFMDNLELFDTSDTNSAATKVSSQTPPTEVLSDASTSDSSAHSPPPALIEAETGNGDVTQKTKVNVSRKRQRDEIEYLRSKVNELEEHLKVVQQAKTLENAKLPTWQKRADQARIAKQIALNENEKLKHELEEQIEFAKVLQVLLKKRPKLMMLPTLENEQWRVFKLVKDAALRHHAVHEIFHRLYQNTDVALIESGVLDKFDGYTSVIPRFMKSTGDLVLQASYTVTLHFDFNIVTEFAWLLTLVASTRKCNSRHIRHWNNLISTRRTFASCEKSTAFLTSQTVCSSGTRKQRAM